MVPELPSGAPGQAPSQTGLHLFSRPNPEPSPPWAFHVPALALLLPLLPPAFLLGILLLFPSSPPSCMALALPSQSTHASSGACPVQPSGTEGAQEWTPQVCPGTRSLASSAAQPAQGRSSSSQAFAWPPGEGIGSGRLVAPSQASPRSACFLLLRLLASASPPSVLPPRVSANPSVHPPCQPRPPTPQVLALPPWDSQTNQGGCHTACGARGPALSPSL